MRRTIFEYIEFLLPIHDCIVIPEFGGFIVNVDPSFFQNDGVCQPSYSIVFNPELKYNDGILTSCLIKNDSSLSYNTANQLIKDFVKSLKNDIKSGKDIVFGNIGILASDQAGNITFYQNESYIYPALSGLQPVHLERLSYINQVLYSEKKKVYNKYILGGIAAIAVAVVLFVFPTNNIQEESPISQNAGFISSLTYSPLSGDNKEILENFTTKVKDAERKISAKTYYIIIGGEENKNRADKLLGKIRESDFPQASVIESFDRYRIYVSSFNEKGEAEAFLNDFRKNNPKYETAWLYSKRK